MLSAPLVHGAYRGGPSFEPGARLVMDFVRGRYRRGPGRGRVASDPAGVSGWQSVGHAGFGRTRVNGAYPPFAPDAPLIGAGGLLIPESRTALAAWQGDLTNAVWSPFNLARELASDGYVRISQVGQPSICTITQFSVAPDVGGQSIVRWAILKRGTGSKIELRCNPSGETGWQAISLDWNTGVVTPTPGVLDYGFVPLSDGAVFLWFRMLTIAGNPNTQRLSLRLGGSPTDPAGSDVFVRGCGAEVGLYPVLAPIFNGALPATRTGVAQSVGDLGPILTPPYVVFVEADLPAIDGVTRDLLSLVGSSGNTVRLSRGSSNTLTSVVITGGVTQEAPFGAAGFTGQLSPKLALRLVEGGGARLSFNGTLGTAKSISVPALSTLHLGSQGGGQSWLNGSLRRVAILPDISDAQLQALTA